MATKMAMLAVWALTLAGGVVLIGGVAALTSDAGPIPEPYKLAWTAISLEVTTLLVTLYAIAVGPYRNWRATCLAMYAVITPILITLCNTVLTAKGGLPGSNGSETRANVVAAGLILVSIGNFLQMLVSAVHDVEHPVQLADHHHNQGGKVTV
uniref:Uncharacterized protein n=2 Tax=Chlorella vulgaris TaxID=3077 RepID=A4GUE2_CHLVU|nr:unknown [Chlorella vulgaris]